MQDINQINQKLFMFILKNIQGNIYQKDVLFVFLIMILKEKKI